jgi:hypothetical protein
MHTHADKIQENKSHSVANAVSQKHIGGESAFQFVDNRPEAIAQRKLQDIAINSHQVMRLKAMQEMVNSTPQHTIQRRLIIGGTKITQDSVPIHGLPSVVNDVYRQMLSNGQVTGDAALLADLQANEDAIKRQLTKWTENNPGSGGASAKSHPDFGRKQQNRSYTNLYDLARALLGWVQSQCH